MKFTLVRSVALAALVAGAALVLPATASAETTADTPKDATTHASATWSDAGTGPALGFWIGGGTLALAGGAIAVGATVRRHRHDPQT
ncbi:hypothetical protein [Microbacterium sp. 5K110]|jgi:hypothetical protein|uniref:hypothetical protein n=1 Tax=unclassified Microbacterium TaxID=2609290 RepID=UPI0010FF0B8D|nr:hypothetical protein [Microbacterium sp. 5K110]TLF31211.1 hypothetical protein FE256_08380 [Microbacterium sp. 5K110]